MVDWCGVSSYADDPVVFKRGESDCSVHSYHCEELNIGDTWGGNWKNKTMRCKSDSSKLETK